MSVEVAPNDMVVGTNYTVTATVLDSGGGPVAEARVIWSPTKIYGPNQDQPEVTPTAFYFFTDSNGQTTATVRSINAGVSTITAYAIIDSGWQHGNAQATWTTGDPVKVKVDPSTHDPTVNEQHTVMARITDIYNNPVDYGPTSVVFTVSGTGAETPTSGTVTSSGGPATFTFTFTSAKAGTSYVTATSQSLQEGSAKAVWVCPQMIFWGDSYYAYGIWYIPGFSAYNPAFTGGVNLATADFGTDGCGEVVTGADRGGGPHVRVFRPQGLVSPEFMAYDPNFAGGVRVAVGDVNNDGIADIITGAGPGGGPHVKVFSGKDLSLIYSFMAYDPSFAGGIFVAAGDVSGDGKADIITGADAGGGSHVKVFSGADLSLLHSFMAYEPAFLGGVRVAAGDVNDDDVADIITGAGPGGGPHVQVFSGADLSPLSSFMAYIQSFTGGVYVAAGDEDRDGHADIVTGAGPGGGPHVRSFNGASLPAVLTEFMAYDQSFPGGVKVAAGDVNGDGYSELLTALGSGSTSRVRLFDTTKDPEGPREKGIDEFQLVSADRSAISIDVYTTNGGCGPEELERMEWSRVEYQVAVRSYYRDLPGVSACALFSESHVLRLEGLGAGRFTISAPTLGYGANGPIEIVVNVP